MRVEVLDGPGSTTAAGALFIRVYPADVLGTVAWRDVVSAPADRRVVLMDNAGDIIAAAGRSSERACEMGASFGSAASAG